MAGRLKRFAGGELERVVEGMSDFNDLAEYRRNAFQFREKRRVAYNLVLAPSSVAAYMIPDSGVEGLEIRADRALGEVLIEFALAAIGANICHTLAYVAELWFAESHRRSSWMEFGRPALWTVGTCLGVPLAMIGARSIALMN